jgi:hypothetical protein
VINVDLLRETLQHIKEHREEWDQKQWRCGAAACFAGHAAILAGAEWEGDSDFGIYVLPPNAKSEGEFLFVGAYAQAVLGLSNAEADDLFWQDNTLADLEAKVAALIELAKEYEAHASQR